MPVSTVSSKGQVTLPARLRRKIGIKPNDRVVIEATDDALLIRKAADVFELEGFLGKALPGDEEGRRMAAGIARRVAGGTT
jgi:AbrB family looped-hinge helix DNA binding protein